MSQKLLVAGCVTVMAACICLIVGAGIQYWQYTHAAPVSGSAP